MDDFLNYVLLQNTVKNWLTALAFVVGGFIAGKIASWVAASILRKISAKTKSRIGEIILSIVKNPLTLFVFLYGVSLGLNFLVFGEPIDLWVGRIFSVIMVLVAAYAIDKLFNAILVEYMPGNALKGASDLQVILRKVTGTLIWIIAFVMVLNILGYNINAILAGLGLGGAAIALASKDTLANFFGSITVFVDKPFKINDRIKISGFDGYITEMGMRTSRLRTLENQTVIIPNSIFASTPIINYSSEVNTKVSQSLNISKEIGLKGLEDGIALLKTICSKCSGVEGNTEAGLAGIGGAAYQVNVIFYISKNAPYLETMNTINMEILRRFEEAGIKLA